MSDTYQNQTAARKSEETVHTMHGCPPSTIRGQLAVQEMHAAALGSDPRFWSKIEVTPGCWLWTGSRSSGYGQFALPRAGSTQRIVRAHRYAWELANGSASGLCVLHRCDEPTCVRPDHLFLGTQQDNLEDMRAKGRDRPRGRVRVGGAS